MAAIDKLLESVIVKGASDLHLSSLKTPKIRLHGKIITLNSEILDESLIYSMIKEIAPQFFIDQFNNKFDTDFAYSIADIHRFRINVFKDKNGIGAVLRHIPNDIPDFKDISLEKGASSLCELNKGLILVTGPTGSGKSTTLAAMINRINETRAFHIITIEDPIEFVYSSKRCLIHQRELHVHTKSYHDALRTVLRQDPDVILVGEMRDMETTRLAIESAETGHLVFATLHTNSAYSTITRIINQFGEEEQELIRVMLADNLRGVICQSLLQREDISGGGRIAAREIWLHTPAGANLIRENKIHQIPSVLESNQDIGMKSFNSSLSELVGKGIISSKNALFESFDQKDLESRLLKFGFK